MISVQGCLQLLIRRRSRFLLDYRVPYFSSIYFKSKLPIESYPTLFDAILAAQEVLGAAVIIFGANENEVRFRKKASESETFTCIVDDGYQRYMKHGEIRLNKKAR